MRHLIYSVVLTTVVLGPFLQVASAQDDLDQGLDQITKRIDKLESRIQRGMSSGILFLFGIFCALWAQNTNRNPWLWFFFGWFFHVITVLVLLEKNSDDLRQARGEPPSSGLYKIIAIAFGVLLLAVFAWWVYMSVPG